MADLTLSLGGFVFQDFEIPERISGLGGEQMLVVQKLVGGDRTIDAMGRDDAPISWSGRFRGQDAVSRALAVDAMRIAGGTQELTFGDFSLTVVIERFTYEFERFYEIPYTISLEVLSDQTNAGAVEGPGVDEMLRSDNDWAQSLGSSIGNATLSGLLGNLNTAVAGVTNFATASTATLNSVLSPIAQVQDQVSGLISTAEATLGSVSTLGGIAPGLSPAVLAASLTGQVSAMTGVANLYDLQNVMGRMTTNIQAIDASGAYVTQAGGDLYRLAEQAYGDATEWATIAHANGLTEPVLSGVNKILVPPLPAGTAGVLA